MSMQKRLYTKLVLTYNEDIAGGMMDTKVITVRADISLDAVLRYLRRRQEIPDVTDNLFVVDRKDKFLGLLPLRKLLTSSPTAIVEDVMDTPVQLIHVNLTNSDVVQLFQCQDLVSAPVVDDEKHLRGRITVDDVVNVIIEDAVQSLLAMGGLTTGEDTFGSASRTTPRRAVWLGTMSIDPALAAGVILKTITDTVGFVSFLGLTDSLLI
jgi:magnesium transporter